MSDLSIQVDASEIATAKAALGEHANAWSSMVTKIIAETNKWDRAVKASSDIQMQAIDRVLGQATTNATNQWVAQTNRRLQLMKNSEAAAVKAANAEAAAVAKAAAEHERATNAYFAQQRRRMQMMAESERMQEKAVADAQKEAQALDTLRAKYDEGFRAVQRYNQIKSELSTLLENNRMDLVAYQAQLEAVTQEFVQFQNGAAVAGNRFAQMSDGFITGSKAANRFQAQIQNSGYQVADFAVQLQGGTHWLVALGQQGSQLVAMVPGWGALAGAALAIATALGYMYTRADSATESAKKLGATLNDLDEFEDIFGQAGVTLEDNFGGSIERVREKFGDMVADIVSFKVEKVLGTVNSGVEGVAASVAPSRMDRIFGAIASGVTAQYDSGDFSTQMSDELREAEELAQRLRNVFEEIGGETSGELAQSLLDAKVELETMADVPPEVLKEFEALIEAVGGYDVILKMATEEMVRQEEAAQRQLENIINTNVAYQDQLTSMRDEVNLRQVAAQYGDESYQYRLAEQEIAERQLAVELSLQGVSETRIGILVDMLRENFNIEESQTRQEANTQTFIDRMDEAVSASEDLADRLGDAAVEALVLAGVDITSPISSAAASAAVLAGNLGIALNAAISLQNMRSSENADNLIYGQVGARGDPRLYGEGGRNSGYEDSADYVPPPPGFEFDGPSPPGRPGSFIDAGLPPVDRRRGGRGGRGGGGGRGGAGKSPEEIAEDIAEAMADIQDETEWMAEMSTLNEEERRHAEVMRDITGEFGENAEKVSDNVIEALTLERIAAEDLLEAAENAQEATERMVESLVDGFTGAVLSVVEGTESVNDAFRGMLRDMLLDIYKQKVMEPFSDFAGNFLTGLFSANGNAFGPSGHISYFSKGDMFNSPTAFQFGGGKLGVMGEAGPEAVMPLKRGPDGKLGVQASGSGDINIHNHWHIAANGDESVRKIVRQEAPKVAEMAKNQVLKARVQGGSYANAFKK